MKPIYRNKTLLLLVLFAALLFSSCASRNDEADWAPAADSGYFYLPMTGGSAAFSRQSSVPQTEYDMWFYEVDMPEAAPGADQVEWEDLANQGIRHVIQTAEIEMETEDFDNVVESLRQLAPTAGGYIESEMLSARAGKMFTIVLRIPTAYFYEVLQEVESLADVRVMNQRAQDVTDQFYDMIGSLELRRIEEERLLALIEEATYINDLLALESRLSNTRLSIEMYQAQLSNLAGQIAYSTIAVTLIDISEEERVIAAAPTIGERIGGAFGDSVDGTVNAFQNIVVFIAGVIIPVILFAAFGLAAYKVMRAVIRSGKLRRNV